MAENPFAQAAATGIARTTAPAIVAKARAATGTPDPAGGAVKATVELPRQLWRDLKSAAAQADLSIKEACAQAVGAWVEARR
jgi:hypothetical protein